MSDDAELLKRYARDGAADALEELVKRHINFVYRVALREVGGDAHHASDIAQAVFIKVARKAECLSQHRVLKGWLFNTARYLAANLVRSEQRRHRREKEAYAMQQIGDESKPLPDWASARPLINDALGALSRRDREAVLLRYFEGRDYAEIGARSSLTADAARLRVERALERMRAALARCGVASTSAVLAATLTAQAVLPAPVGLSAIVTNAALASAATGTGIATFLTFMSTTKIQTALLAAIVLMGSLGVILQQQARATLQHQLIDLRREDSQVAHLRAENARLTVPADNDDHDLLANKLAQLRNRADELTKQLAATPAPPLAPGMIPSSAWQNRGRATAGEALETLLWAKEGADFGVIVATMDLTRLPPETLIRLERVVAAMSENERTTLGINSPADLVALNFTLGRLPDGPTVGAQFARAMPDGADDLMLSVRTQSANGMIRRPPDMRFHRAEDGWKWIPAASDVEELANKLD